jgi:hypothetical protein
MNHVIESIGSWGVVTTPLQIRLGQVKPGDIIDAPEGLRKYPISHRYSRIAHIDENGIASVCEGMGSAFLCQDGHCDISGGPWWSIPISVLEPTHALHQATYWNWGDNCPGAAQGVQYNIFRPLHRLTVHPYDLKHRSATTEQNARKGIFNHETPLSEQEWTVFLKGKGYCENETLWVFRKVETPT